MGGSGFSWTSTISVVAYARGVYPGADILERD
jgi:hypothetical protein